MHLGSEKLTFCALPYSRRADFSRFVGAQASTAMTASNAPKLLQPLFDQHVLSSSKGVATPAFPTKFNRVCIKSTLP